MTPQELEVHTINKLTPFIGHEYASDIGFSLNQGTTLILEGEINPLQIRKNMFLYVHEYLKKAISKKALALIQAFKFTLHHKVIQNDLLELTSDKRNQVRQELNKTIDALGKLITEQVAQEQLDGRIFKIIDDNMLKAFEEITNKKIIPLDKTANFFDEIRKRMIEYNESFKSLLSSTSLEYELYRDVSEVSLTNDSEKVADILKPVEEAYAQVEEQVCKAVEEKLKSLANLDNLESKDIDEHISLAIEDWSVQQNEMVKSIIDFDQIKLFFHNKYCEFHVNKVMDPLLKSIQINQEFFKPKIDGYITQTLQETKYDGKRQQLLNDNSIDVPLLENNKINALYVDKLTQAITGVSKAKEKNQSKKEESYLNLFNFFFFKVFCFFFE